MDPELERTFQSVWHGNVHGIRAVVFWPCLVALLGLALGFLWPPKLWADVRVRYRMAIEGVRDKDLRQMLESVSDTYTLRDQPPASMSLLRRRVDRDIPHLVKALRSQGFYGSQVGVEIETQAEPIHVTFRIDLGSPYEISSVDIRISGTERPWAGALPEGNDIGLPSGQPAKSKTILEGEKAVLRWFRNRGFPFPRSVERKVIVDHATRTVSVAFWIEPGKEARFGPVEIIGLESADESFIRRKIPWEEGSRFDATLVTDLRKRLIATGLFATVEVTTRQELDEEKHLPVVITVKERKHRSIKVGASYKTDEGFGEKVSWEHRNFLGHGERLVLTETASEIALAAEGAFRRPGFLRRDQSLLLNLRGAQDQPDAYTSRNITASFEIERELSERMTLGAGMAFRASDVEQLAQKEQFRLLSLPGRFDWDRSDDLLDPTRGGRLAFRLAPFHDILTDGVDFFKAYSVYSHYLQIWDEPIVVLAARGAVGSIMGEPRDAIPADERFYAGGGDSVRGFPFQSLGPLLGDEPIGGRSLLEVSMEVRLRVSDTIGLVAFLDGGSAFEPVWPDLEEGLGWGAGLGLRYFTSIGPLRLDVGFPLNRRQDVDDKFQIYLSLGQAF